MPDRTQELQIVRRAYARQMLAAAGVEDTPLETAFASVAREDYLGPGPWPILRWGRGYELSPSDDPVYLYADVAVSIDRERLLNNGVPSFHALLLSRLEAREGEHVVHVGAGTGYYTALLARLVGEPGRVTAIEQDAGLARRAAENLKALPQVRILHGDGTAIGFDPADGIYVNAGATRPLDLWLDRLKDGGRLILPLTTRASFDPKRASFDSSRGAVFRIARSGDAFSARWLSPVSIFPCAGARDDASEAALARAFDRGGWDLVRSLRRDNSVPPERCWLRADGWCLSYD